jgi:uncharacterized protein YfaS (alpha-2-macroglobulin family)
MSIKSYQLPVYIITISLFLFTFSCKNKKSTTNSNQAVIDMETIKFNYEDEYSSLWDTVVKQENKGLYKSALATVEEIYKSASKDKNSVQVVKALIHKMKYNSYLEEDNFVKSLYELQTISNTSKFPLKQIIHSITAETYWNYYQQNQWKINGRTYSSDIKEDDIRTWDLKTLTSKTISEYSLSLSSKDSLQHTQIQDFKVILNHYEKTEVFRPTLYDFLAYRAISFFENTQHNITKPADFFTLNEKGYFSDVNTFSNLEITTEDSAANHFYAIKMYQELTNHQLRRENTAGIIETSLRRLKFVKSQSKNPIKEGLYLKALTNLTVSYPDDAEIATVWSEVAHFHNLKGNAFNLKTGENQWKKKKAIDICDATMIQFPESYGAKECKALKLQIESKSMGFAMEKSQRPETPIKLVFEHTNLNQVYFKIVKVDWDFEYKLKDQGYNKELIALNKLPAVRNWVKDIENKNDYQKHSSHLHTKGLPFGKYYILASEKADFTVEDNAVTYTDFWVTKISFTSITSNDDNETILKVVDSETGEALPDVTIHQYTYDYNRGGYVLKRRGKYQSNDNGNASVFPQKGNSYSYNYYYYFKKGDDEYYTDNAIYQYDRGSNKERKVTQTTFFTDRGIYRPGQKVYFKGIVLEHFKNEHQIVTKARQEVTLFDVNYQKVASLEVVTNEYGTFAGAFTLPTGAMNGTMSIVSEDGNRKYIQVEEYKRPKFTVNLDPIEGSYKLNQSISIEGKAKAYAGYFLDDAVVNYRVTRTARFPYWCWYRWGYSPNSASIEITSGKTKTDNNGGFKIDFDALADESVDKKYSPTFSYQVEVSVTDINGETQSNTSYVNVGYNAMNFTVGVNDKVNKEKEQELAINATNLNGKLVDAKGTIKITKLIEPTRIYRASLLSNPDIKTIDENKFHELFPYDEYDRENEISKLKKGEEVLSLNFDTKDTRSLDLETDKLAIGRYVLEAKTLDEFGVEVIDIRYFTVFDPKAELIPTKETWWTTDLKITGEPGEKAAFIIGTAEEELLVNYEIEHQGDIVYSELLTLKNEQRKIEIPIKEIHRGNFNVSFTTTKHSRFIQERKTISVPYTNKNLDLTFESFRNKLLPGQKEEWKIKIRGAKGDKVAAELLATMYDASLDEFASNYIGLSIYSSFYSNRSFSNSCFERRNSSTRQEDWNTYYSFSRRDFSTMNWFGYSRYQFGYGGSRGITLSKSAAFADIDMEAEESRSADSVIGGNQAPTPSKKDEAPGEQKINSRDENDKDLSKKSKSAVKPRTNFNETAFFYPQLETNKNGDVIVKFTIPESLTKWKFLALAHTKDLKIGTTQKELVTQKELMVVPNAPRFFREGDKISFSSKVVNLSENDIKGTVKLELFDALSMQKIDVQLKNTSKTKEIVLEKGKSTVANWSLEIPKGYSAITYRVSAEAGKHTDGEEMAVPVLTNRMLVTESLPLPVKKSGETKFTFKKFMNQSNGSKTLENHKLTLEFTSNPAWYAIQALPYLMEYPYECAEQTFSRYYANSIASNIANSNPKIKRVFDQWAQYDSEAFLSNLEKNQELKALLLEETPWVLNAQDEQERKKRIALLFDLNKMQNEKERTIRKLEKMQLYNGAWPWFDGMRENRYITQHIVTGLGHLNQLKVEDNSKSTMLVKAVSYLDNQMHTDYESIKANVSDYQNKQTISNFIVQYLYARSFFPDLKIKNQHQEAYDYFYKQSKTYWLEFNLYTQGMIALSAHRKGDKRVAEGIMASIKERAIYNEEMGMYWKDLSGGYYWYQAPIETQALLIEAFDEVTDDQNSINEMKVWLLKQKQTTDWKTTKATADACYALLLKGTDILSETDIPVIKLGSKTVSIPKTEAGTGYFKTSWSGSDIKPEMGNVSITKKQNSVAWGALYWQYFEDLDKITPHETPLTLTKKLYIERNSSTGKVLDPITETSPIKIGDKIKVRVVLKTDRNLEYVHLKDMRASAFEPTNVISRYKWQDGLGYYETTKDASTNFFMDYVAKGTYVFEYDLIASQEGNFSNGITSIQCMYAPEFTSHSEGIRVEVKK